MALAVTNVSNIFAGNSKTGATKHITTATVTFDSSYPTGGEDVTEADLGLTNVDAVFVNQDIDGAEQVVFDPATDKLLVFTADGTEAGAASDQSGVTVQILAVGS